MTITEPIRGLTVELRPKNDGDLYELGVVVNGAWVALGGAKGPGLDEDIREAEAAAAEAKANEPEPEPEPVEPAEPAAPQLAPGSSSAPPSY